MEFAKYCENYTNIRKNLYEKQAMKLLTRYALKKTQTQLLESSMYKCQEIR